MAHNSVSLAVNSFQSQWSEELDGKTPKLIRWLIKEDEQALLNGFFQIECTEEGESEDLFISLFTPFSAQEGAYTRALIADFISEWNNDKNITQYGIEWSPNKYKSLVEEASKPDTLFLELFTEFKKEFCDNERLVILLLPIQIDDLSAYNKWLVAMSEKLPENTAICIVDYLETKSYANAVEELNKSALTLQSGKFDLGDMMANIASSSEDASEPNVKFQQCLLKMSKATKSKNKVSLSNWGDKAIQTAKRTGKASFVATAYLAYAGFLIHFKDKKALEMLDKGDYYAHTAIEEGDEAAKSLLIQIYAFKSAYYSVMGKKEDATLWSLNQARYATTIPLLVYAMTAYRQTAQLALRGGKENYRTALEEGYTLSEQMPEKDLESSEVRTLAYHYMNLLEDNNEKQRMHEIGQRMKELFGVDWNKDIPSLKDKYAKIDFTQELTKTE